MDHAGGLTTAIGRKLQDGIDPAVIVQELVDGGLSQASAQRFVDRAMADAASAPRVEWPQEPSAPVGTLDAIVDTRRRRGRPFRLYATLATIAALAVPLVAGVLLSSDNVSRTLREGIVRQLIATHETESAVDAMENLLASALPVVQPPEPGEVVDLLAVLKSSRPYQQCELISRLSLAQGHERKMAFDGLMAYFIRTDNTGKICIAEAVARMGETATAAGIYESWGRGDDAALRRSAVSGLGKLGGHISAGGLRLLEEELASPYWDMRYLVVCTLATMGPEAAALLEIAAEDDDERISTIASRALKKMQP
jgi:hypothetical protein